MDAETFSLDDRCAAALAALETVFETARARLREETLDAEKGRVSGAKLETLQFRAHGLAWLATYVEALRRMADWRRALSADGRGGAFEDAILSAAYGEYLAQVLGESP